MQFELYSGIGEGEEPSLKETGKKYKFIKKCNCCGLEFRTNSPQKLFCDRTHYIPCPICGTPVLKKGKDFTGPPTCCSTKCRHDLRKKNMPKKVCILCGKEFTPKTGVGKICDADHYRNCEICGKSFSLPRNHTDLTTCSTECSKEKTRRFYQEKYGVDHPMQNAEVQKHHQESIRKRHVITSSLKTEKFIEKRQNVVMNTDIKDYQVPCAQESKLYLDSIGVESTFGKRLEEYNYDIVVESQMTVIDLDSTYTHSTVIIHDETPREWDRQLKKTQVANSHGYRCIHIFDWEDTKKVLNLLMPKKKIAARKCEIYKLRHEVAKEFIEKNHIQGNCRGQMLFLGLVKDGELYQVISFGRPRYSKSHNIELLRLCSKTGYSIIGGASKLFKFAIDTYEMEKIVSYCDISKFDGKVYETIGMKLLRKTIPQEIWSKDDKYITANLLRQRGYDQLFKTNYGKGADNEELMLRNGWLPIYDCGMKVYEK